MKILVSCRPLFAGRIKKSINLIAIVDVLNVTERRLNVRNLFKQFIGGLQRSAQSSYFNSVEKPILVGNSDRMRYDLRSQI